MFLAKGGAGRGGAGPAVKRQPGLCSPGRLMRLASSLAGESVVEEWSLIFWKLSVSASECGPPPSFSIVSSEMTDQDAVGVGVCVGAGAWEWE